MFCATAVYARKHSISFALFLYNNDMYYKGVDAYYRVTNTVGKKTDVIISPSRSLSKTTDKVEEYRGLPVLRYFT